MPAPDRAGVDRVQAPPCGRRGRRALALAAAGVLAAVWGAGLLLRANGGPALPVDLRWAEWVRDVRDAPLTAVAETLNVLGGGPVVPVVTVGAVVALLVARRRWDGAFVGASALLNGLDVQLMKAVVARPRPEGGLVVTTGDAFPSGHTADAAALAVALAVVAGVRWAWLAAAVWVAAMAWSRTLLDVHWFTDVMAAALIGSAVPLLLLAVLPPRRPSPAPGRSDPVGPTGTET